MRVAVISDIHGNYPALQAVLSDISKEKADKIYCLGDLVGYYCMINEVIDSIRELGIQTLMGNHDFALLYNNGVIERSKTCTKILGRQLNDITKENHEFLKSLGPDLEFSTGNDSFYCVHGGLGDPVDEYIGKIDEAYFKKYEFKFDNLISGHTHIPRNEVLGKWRYLNPGSVGQPRDGNPEASYLLLSEDEYRHKRVEYDIDRIAGEMKKNNYEPYIYEILYKGVKIGG
jgi:putative phosphoesterase